MTCRGSRFKDGIGVNSKEWQATNYKGERNFLRKWGSMVQHDEYLMPIISNKYQIRVVLDLIDAAPVESVIELLRIVEPRVSQIVLFDEKHMYRSEIFEYLENEQTLTDYEMFKRVLYNPNETELAEMDIEIFSTPLILGKNSCMFVQIFSPLFDRLSEVGLFEYENNKIRINKIKRDYQLDNIINTNISDEVLKIRNDVKN